MSAFVPDALGGQFPLELGKGQHDVAEQSSCRGGRVEALCNGDEPDAVLSKTQSIGKSRGGAGESVDFVSDHHIYAPGLDIGQERLKGWAVGVRPE
ncbi:MAG: hypothetical protein IPH01_00595 [Elusimicrobia bacterium]|nr:hypothetical protein [Elusimicrobiota bacterium]